jgi:hypothetical protein
VTYDLLARLVIYGGGLVACWALYRTVRDNWTRIREALRG